MPHVDQGSLELDIANTDFELLVLWPSISFGLEVPVCTTVLNLYDTGVLT